MQCDQNGIALLHYDGILSSPAQYNTGPHDRFFADVAGKAEEIMVHPIWYVIQRGQRISHGTCGDGYSADLMVGFNPDDGTELHVLGRVEKPPRF